MSSTEDWIKMMWYIYTTEHFSAIKKKKMLPFATAWMDLENIMLTEKKNSQRKTNTISFHSHVEFNEQTELRSKTETDLEIKNRLTALRGVIWWGRDPAKRKKDPWSWTTVWRLQGEGVKEGITVMGKNNGINNKVKRKKR